MLCSRRFDHIVTYRWSATLSRIQKNSTFSRSFYWMPQKLKWTFFSLVFGVLNPSAYLAECLSVEKKSTIKNIIGLYLFFQSTALCSSNRHSLYIYQSSSTVHPGAKDNALILNFWIDSHLHIRLGLASF